jgi:Fe2+ transport system protein FeoA
MSQRNKSLAELNCGEYGVIHQITGKHLNDDGTCVRLLEMGFTPGQEVRVIARSPFKDPVAVSVRGSVIALRKHEAECVLI